MRLENDLNLQYGGICRKLNLYYTHIIKHTYTYVYIRKYINHSEKNTYSVTILQSEYNICCSAHDV